MKILIELEVDQEAYDRKYGPGTEWWGKYMYDRISENNNSTYRNIPKPPSDYNFAPEKLKASWDAMLRDILTEGLYDWTQLYEEALKINITMPE